MSWSSLRCALSARTTTLSSLVRPSVPFPSLPARSLPSCAPRSPFPSLPTGDIAVIHGLLVSARHHPDPRPFVHVVPPSALRRLLLSARHAHALPLPASAAGHAAETTAVPAGPPPAPFSLNLLTTTTTTL
ncbi:hypothetical protein C8R44DRAFT_866299 [Mycena epipterygia]|nr:hypothetical protein C8R44DRAFT_866299 [Mycena epipterygia]